MKISARNVLQGVVKSVNHGAVNSEIVIELPGGVEIVSVITKSSAESLGLAAGKPAFAVVKASNVMIAVEEREENWGELGELGGPPRRV